VAVADDFHAPIPLEKLAELLPEEGPATVTDLATWLAAHPAAGRVAGRWAFPPTALAPTPDEDRPARAERYVRTAGDLVASDLRGVSEWLCFLGVTGSTAYGNPTRDDDCDLMAVVRPGSVWLFMAYTFLRLRLRRRSSVGRTDPSWCLNYTLDERAALDAFSRPRGFLFAREALVARPVRGEGYYRGLLAQGRWLQQEIPRLYARWQAEGLPPPSAPRPVSPVPRALNGLLFPLLASYLQLKGLWANHRLRRFDRGEEGFRTVTRLDRMELQTVRFARLSERMAPATQLPPG
jgi:hypothetical protein